MTMTSHLFLMVVFASLVSLVFAVMMKDDLRGQLRLGAILFLAFVGGAILLGWLAFSFPL
jgi:heme A synthase